MQRNVWLSFITIGALLVACGSAVNAPTQNDGVLKINAVIDSVTDDSPGLYTVAFTLTNVGTLPAIIDLCGTYVQRKSAQSWFSVDHGQCAGSDGGGELLPLGASLRLSWPSQVLEPGDSIRILPTIRPDSGMVSTTFRAEQPGPGRVVPVM